MSVDTRLLQCFTSRSDYKKLVKSVPVDALEPETRVLIEDIGMYFDRFDHQVIDPETFLSWCMKFRHPKMNEQQKVIFMHLVQKMTEPLESTVKEGILSELHELRLVTGVGNAVHLWKEGELPNVQSVLQQLLNRYKMDTGTQADSWINEDIHNLLEEMQDSCGIHWRLDCLNRSMRGLRPGDFGIIAARPDRGKTTFLSSEITFMAPQLPPDKSVLWLNNEGLGKRIIPRLYQSALGLTFSELVQLRDAGTLRDEYTKKVGDHERIKVYDIHGMGIPQVERILENGNPGIVIIDMIDNVRGFKTTGERTDEKLESMYQWFREVCTGLEFIGLASSQISVEGDGLSFPTLSMLKDSKTGKQGACDFQLMIGARNDYCTDTTRFLGLPKNKLRREGGPSDPKATVSYVPERARYEDIGEEPLNPDAVLHGEQNDSKG